MKLHPTWRTFVAAIFLGAIFTLGCSSDSGGSKDTGPATDPGPTDVAQGDTMTDPGPVDDTGGVLDTPTGEVSGGLSTQSSPLEGDPCTPPTSAIVITEFMANPDVVSDAYGEWIELHNPGAADVDITGWVLTEEGANKHQFTTANTLPAPGPLVVPAGGYVLLCRNGDPLLNGGLACNYQYTGTVLTNTGDEIYLFDGDPGAGWPPDIDPAVNFIDGIKYTGTVPTGASVALRHPFLETEEPPNTLVMPASPNDPASWAAMNYGVSTTSYDANNEGTPGAKNADVWDEQEVAACAETPDDNICTYNLCEAGACKNPFIPNCCTGDGDCNDGKDCTTDSCDVPNNQCVFTPIPNCCTSNDDCLDANPCNSDYCDYKGQCRHSAYNIVPGCCWADPDINPITEQPWANPDEKKAYLDSQCDDKNPCTAPDFCDEGSNTCQSGPPVADCCLSNADCVPPSGAAPCTFYTCINKACYITDKSIDGDCCAMPDDPNYNPVIHSPEIMCDDGDPCTNEVCFSHNCRNLFDAGNCCPDDNYCQLYEDDNNPCTIEKCVAVPATGGKECQHFYQALCSQELPYIESFNGSAGLDEVGWKITDYGTNSLAHWIFGTAGDLGPDEHVTFQWNPTTALVKSVAVTPIIDASSAGTSAYNPEQATTVQWRMSYKHSVPGEPVTLTVLASSDGDYENGNVIWQQTVTEDIEYGLYSFQLDNSLKFASTLQIGFMIDTGTASTFNMDNWKFDDVVVAEGVSNILKLAKLFQCETDSCSLATGAVLVTESTTDVPELTMVVNEHYKYVLCYQDLDFDSTLAQYWGRPHAFLDGSPLDKPGFVIPTDMTGFGSSCYMVKAGVDAMCGEGLANYFCVIDVNPGGLESNQGIYRVGFLGQDEWKQGQVEYDHSPFQSLNKTTISVLLADGYLVWSPKGLLDPSATAVKNALTTAGRKAQIITKMDLISDLSQYDGIFGILGVYGRYHQMSATEASKLKTYLDTGIQNKADPGDPPEYKGGRLYLEGGEFWKTGVSQTETVLHTQNYFKIDGISDGSSKLDGPVDGKNFWYGLDFNYSQSPLFNSWIDRIEHTAGEGGREVQHNGGALDFATAVSYEQCGPSSTCWDLDDNRVCDLLTEDVNTDGSCNYLDCNCGNMYRTIGASVLFGGLANKGTGTTDELMGRILDFFENGYPPCTVDPECDDGEVCTTDTCNSGVCLNMPIQDCVPCKNDEIQEDGSPSCGVDQACWVEKGYCVNIMCLDETGGMAPCLPAGTHVAVADSGQVPRNFGIHPKVVDVTATSAQPGWIRDIQVKVKVTHFYRGDVKLSLQAPDGTTVQLKKSSTQDSDSNVYVTYDIGSPVDCDSPPCDTLDAFNGKVLSGAWKLIAEDMNPLIFNGLVEDWKLYASYEAPECTPATVEADCGDNSLCTLDECINFFCQWTDTDCDDNNTCTLDACDPLTGQCSHTPLPGAGCGCTQHADCPGDEVCLNDSDGQVCSNPPCTCKLICDLDLYGADCGTYHDTGYPVSIPDGSGTVTRINTISGVDGVVRQLWVKVVTDHNHIGDLTAELCNGTTCVKLHYLTGGANAGFYKVYDYDPVDDPAATMADFKTLPVNGDWTLKVSDKIPSLETGTLEAFSVFILKTDCYIDADCDDNNACTQDVCDLAGDVGTCQHITMECEPSADPCKAKVCDSDSGSPTYGTCVETTQPDGTACDDGLYCTVDDECASGVCSGGTARDCTYLDSNCVKGWCDEDVSNCVPIVLMDGVDPGLGAGYDCSTGPCACDAGEPCLGGDYCNAAGNCVQGSQQICPCTSDSDCIDDGDKCNGILGCDEVAGFCDNDQPEVDCDATNPPLPECQKYQCIPLTGACVQKNSQNFSACEDGLFCTVSDYCETGVCKSDTARDCTSLDEECKDGVCDDVADACVGQAKADDTTCELDGLGCTTDWCKSGACEKKENVDCTPEVGDICNNGLCQNLGWGGYDCVQVPKPDGFPCDDDSDPCTTDECQNAVCSHLQVQHCTGPCGGDHAFDAGDGMCGYEDSCVDGIDGYPNGTCTPTCDAPNCAMAASGVIDLPIDESVGCTTTKLTISSSFDYVEGVEVKADVVHTFLADLTIEIVDPQGYEHMMWNHIGGPNDDFFNTFDLSLPVPYPALTNAGVPMCSLKGEDASGDWYLKICDTGSGNGGFLHEWKMYVKGSDATDLNEGHRWQDTTGTHDLGNLDINPATQFGGTTECSVNSTSSNCGGGTGPDRLYKFEITVPKRVTLVVEQGFGNDMIAFIKTKACMEGTGPCTPGTEELCANVYQAGVTPEVIDNQIQPGIYYVGVDTVGGRYDYGPYQFDLRLKTLLPDGGDCVDAVLGEQDLDCLSGHCQNGYCCDHGDCCPGAAWTPWGTDDDPDTIKSDPDWQSAQAVCPAQYRGPQVCDTDVPAGEFLNDCQGHREDANCVNHICEKDQVHDDTACDNSVEANTCNLFVSTVCGDYGPIVPRVQWEPVCLTNCSNDFDCDAVAHCDPAAGATVPDDGVSDVCVLDWGDGNECNENSDCVSNHCQNGYCCDHGDCCPTNDTTGALECPASYTTAPACNDTAGCEGTRKDPICSGFICGDVVAEDDCACAGSLTDNCGLFIPVFCPAAPDPPGPDPDAPAGSCTNSPYPVSGPGQNVWQATDPTCLTSCLDGGSENDALCDDIAHCDPCTEVNGGCSQDDVDGGEVKCQADLPYGYPCNEDTDCKNFSDDALPGHCQNGYCCLAGDCCAINLGPDTPNPDVCPTKASQTGYWSPSVCDDQATCQGHRVDASCTVDFTCGSQDVDDDRGCTAGTESNQCGYYVSVYCTGLEDQAPTTCPTSCDQDVECDPNAHCDPPPPAGCDEPDCAPAEGTSQANCTYDTGEWLCKYDAANHPPAADDPPGSGTMTCQPDLPNDWACNEASDCMGATSTCQLHFCCDVGGCCAGCKVTGYTPTIGGGGTDDNDQGAWGCTSGDPADPCYMHTIWGQMSAGSGRATGAADILDYGYLPNGSLKYGGPNCSPSGVDCD